MDSKILQAQVGFDKLWAFIAAKQGAIENEMTLEYDRPDLNFYIRLSKNGEFYNREFYLEGETGYTTASVYILVHKEQDYKWAFKQLAKIGIKEEDIDAKV